MQPLHDRQPDYPLGTVGSIIELLHDGISSEMIRTATRGMMSTWDIGVQFRALTELDDPPDVDNLGTVNHNNIMDEITLLDLKQRLLVTTAASDEISMQAQIPYEAQLQIQIETAHALDVTARDLLSKLKESETQEIDEDGFKTAARPIIIVLSGFNKQ